MTRWLLAPLMLALLGLYSPADDPPKASKKAEDNAKTVAKTLRAHLKPLPASVGNWDDFQLRIVDRIGESGYAVVAGWEHWADGKETPYVKITTGYLRVYGNNPDALAVLIGRELGSLALGHIPRKDVEGRLSGACANRQRQTDTDFFAVELLLKSGYSLQSAISGLKRELMMLPAGAVRPAMTERIDRLTKLADLGEELWHLMPAFDTGLVFRAIQQYSLAEQCFASVIFEFPQFRDAWVLLTVSRLMRYRSYLVPKPITRKPLAITLANGKTVALGDDSDETVTKLGRPTRTTQAVPHTSLRRLWFEAHGIEILTGQDEVIAVMLAKGPQVKIPGPDGKPVGLLGVGMTRKAGESQPGCGDPALRPFLLSRPGVCAYYPALGVAVLYDRDGPDGVATSIIVGNARR